FKDPIETYENNAYRRVAKGFRNPRRLRDAMLRVSFLTLCVLLGYPVLFAYVNLRMHIVLLTYTLVVLTTAVLYLLACDPLPPCAAKLTEWFRRLTPAREPRSSDSLQIQWRQHAIFLHAEPDRPRGAALRQRDFHPQLFAGGPS